MGPTLKIRVITKSQSFGKRIQNALEGHDVKVSVVRTPKFCSVFKGNGCIRQGACADVVLMVASANELKTGLEWTNQRLRNNCRGSIRNTALIASKISVLDQDKANQVGCRIFKETTEFEMLVDWLSDLEKEAILDAIDSYFELVETIKTTIVKKQAC